MPTINDDFCWLKEVLDPGECPFILPEEEDLLRDRERRLRRRCVECKKFYDDISKLKLDGDNEILDILKIALDELAARNREYERMHQFITLHTSRFEVYHEVLAALQSGRNLPNVAYILLVAITCKEGASFNRAFLLLYDQERDVFTGFFGLGPRTPEEAAKIWSELGDNSLQDLISRFSDKLFEKEREKFSDILERLIIPLHDEVIWNIVMSNRARRIKNPQKGILKEIGEIIGSSEYAISPLTSRDKPVGLVIADNIITNRPIDKGELEFLEVLTYQGSIAIERAIYYEELQRNIHELKKLNVALKDYHETITRMEKMSAVGEILHQIAHDFKNPVTVIGGLANFMLDSIDESHPMYSHLKAIKEEADRLSQMLNSTLKALREKFSLEKDWWDLNALIKKKIDELRAILPPNTRIKWELDPNLPRIFVDLVQVENCIDNLINNAIEAMPRGGTLTLKTRWSPPFVEIIVSDTGVGVKEEVKDRIFEEFFTTKKHGTGLGLPSCKKIIDAHGGRIEFSSEQGKGATFVIKLPLEGGEDKNG